MKKGMRSLVVVVSIIFFVCGNTFANQEPPWTWTMAKDFESEPCQNDKEIVWQQETKYPFTQLMVTPNIERNFPGNAEGFVQVCNAETGEWGCEHRAFALGQGIQRSYGSKPPCFCEYHHVRLELKKGHAAKAFRIRIAFHGKASCKDIKKLFVCLTDKARFKPFDAAKKYDFPSYHIQEVPKLSQHDVGHEEPANSCGPTSCTMLARFFTKKEVSPVRYAALSADSGLPETRYGSWLFLAAHFGEGLYKTPEGKSVHCYVAKFNNGFADLYAMLKKNIPVVVSVQGSLEGAPKSYPKGHLMLVVGWDEISQSVICHDPAIANSADVEIRYKIKDFMAAWAKREYLGFRCFTAPVKRKTNENSGSSRVEIGREYAYKTKKRTVVAADNSRVSCAHTNACKKREYARRSVSYQKHG